MSRQRVHYEGNDALPEAHVFAAVSPERGLHVHDYKLALELAHGRKKPTRGHRPAAEARLHDRRPPARAPEPREIPRERPDPFRIASRKRQVHELDPIERWIAH